MHKRLVWGSWENICGASLAKSCGEYRNRNGGCASVSGDPSFRRMAAPSRLQGGPEHLLDKADDLFCTPYRSAPHMLHMPHTRATRAKSVVHAEYAAHAARRRMSGRASVWSEGGRSEADPCRSRRATGARTGAHACAQTYTRLDSHTRHTHRTAPQAPARRAKYSNAAPRTRTPWGMFERRAEYSSAGQDTQTPTNIRKRYCCPGSGKKAD